MSSCFFGLSRPAAAASPVFEAKCMDRMYEAHQIVVKAGRSWTNLWPVETWVLLTGAGF